MTVTIETMMGSGGAAPARAHESGTTYRLEGEIRDVVPATVFAGGLRLVSRCEATVEMAAPGPLGPVRGRVSMDVYGIVVSPDWAQLPAPEIVAAPGFDFPDLDLQLTGSAYVRTADPGYSQLDGSDVSIEGWVNLESGELEVEARPLQGDGARV